MWLSDLNYTNNWDAWGISDRNSGPRVYDYSITPMSVGCLKAKTILGSFQSVHITVSSSDSLPFPRSFCLPYHLPRSAASILQLLHLTASHVTYTLHSIFICSILVMWYQANILNLEHWALSHWHLRFIFTKDFSFSRSSNGALRKWSREL